MNLPSPIQKLKLPLFEDKNVEVWVKRDDLIHHEISGNKWRKLKYNVDAYNKGVYDSIVTFGGAYSNHILATAKVGADFGIPTIGIIRGEEQLPLNPTLKKATALGMEIRYVTRTDYREKHTAAFINKLKNDPGDVYLIPEGGCNIEGVRGCKDIIEEVNIDFDYAITDCGTGATLAGINLALKNNQKAIGIPVLKGGGFILEEVKQFYNMMNEDLSLVDSIELFTDYHFGGYAKYKPELIEFMRQFYIDTKIKTDPVYTGKLFYGVLDLIQKDYFPKNSKVVVIHTGGLQGIEGFEKRYKTKIY